MTTPPNLPLSRTCTKCPGILPTGGVLCPLCGALNGHYLAVLEESPVTGLAESAECFASDLCRITKFSDRWVLESSEFNACSDPKGVFPLADATLSVVRRILSLY